MGEDVFPFTPSAHSMHLQVHTVTGQHAYMAWSPELIAALHPRGIASMPPCTHGVAPAVQICDAFNANRYPFPDDATRQRQMHAEVTSRLRELHTTNEAGERRREAVINAIARGLEGWTLLVRREKAVYHTMNKLSLDVTSKVRIRQNRIAV